VKPWVLFLAPEKQTNEMNILYAKCGDMTVISVLRMLREENQQFSAS
jgi:hypothetical protein